MTARSPIPLSAAARWVISALVVFHLLAVFIPPLAFQARGPLGGSPSVATLAAPVRGYGEFLYLNRGYAFFAPDPGPSHLFQAALTDEAGDSVEQMFPDLDRDWPRLLYHRHFMLAEFLHSSYQPPGPPEELAESDPEEYAYWSQARRRYESIRRSLVEHLAEVHPDRTVAIRRIEHAIPSFIDFNNDPIELRDRRLYNVLLDQPPPSPITATDATADGTAGPADRGTERLSTEVPPHRGADDAAVARQGAETSP